MCGALVVLPETFVSNTFVPLNAAGALPSFACSGRGGAPFAKHAVNASESSKSLVSEQATSYDSGDEQQALHEQAPGLQLSSSQSPGVTAQALFWPESWGSPSPPLRDTEPTPIASPSPVPGSGWALAPACLDPTNRPSHFFIQLTSPAQSADSTLLRSRTRTRSLQPIPRSFLASPRDPPPPWLPYFCSHQHTAGQRTEQQGSPTAWNLKATGLA